MKGKSRFAITSPQQGLFCFDDEATSRKTKLAAFKTSSRITNQDRVLNFARSCGEHGATREEISSGTGLGIQSVTPAVSQLLRLGLLIESGVTRLTHSGKSAAVLCVRSEEGRGNED